MTEKLITLVATPNDSYGVLFVSETVHRVTGPGVHNPEFNHRVEVWDNTGRPNLEPDRWTEMAGKPGPGKYLDPRRKGTDEPYSFLLSAQATMIALEPVQIVRGETLHIGDTVRLEYPSYEFISAPFTVTAGSLSDPFLTPVNN